MVIFTSNTYQMKREILSFSNKISRNLPKPERKFIDDMNYGILASGSCLLTDIVDQLHEPSRKINIVDRLSRHLAKGIPKDALKAYLTQVKKWCPDQPVIHIDDSDVVKPDGYKFESLGWVRDGSKSTTTKSVYKKGYHVTEACDKIVFLYIVFLLLQYREENDSSETRKSSDKLKHVLDYIELHYAEPITISELSQLCYFNNYYFMRFFKKHMNMTCMEYIKNLRLEKSVERFKQGETSILDVSLSVGFRNLSYFHREFKKKYCMTPSTFIKEIISYSCD